MSKELQKVRLKESSKRERLKREKPAVYEKVIKYVEKVKRGESVALIVLNYEYTCNFACEHCCDENFKIKKSIERKADTRKHLTPESVKELCRQGD